MAIRLTSKAADGCKLRLQKAQGPTRGPCAVRKEVLTAQATDNLACLIDEIAAAFGNDLIQQFARLIMITHLFIRLRQRKLGTDIIGTRIDPVIFSARDIGQSGDLGCTQVKIDRCHVEFG